MTMMPILPFDDHVRHLLAPLSPHVLDIIDQSDQHAGHGGMKDHQTAPGIPTHLLLRIVSDDFQGASLIQRHRTVQRLMAPYLQSGLHALTMSLMTPQEWAGKQRHDP